MAPPSESPFQLAAWLCYCQTCTVQAPYRHSIRTVHRRTHTVGILLSSNFRQPKTQNFHRLLFGWFRSALAPFCTVYACKHSVRSVYSVLYTDPAVRRKPLAARRFRRAEILSLLRTELINVMISPILENFCVRYIAGQRIMTNVRCVLRDKHTNDRT